MAEAAGFVLAVVPLLISAAEQYKNAYDLIARFKRYADEIQELCSTLNIQRTIFKSHTRRLLESCVEQDEAANMMMHFDHARWTDPGLQSAIESIFGDSEHAVVELISLLDKKLKHVGQECAQFEEVIQHNPSDVIFGSKIWRHAVRQKIKLAFRKSDLHSSIERVRTLTQDYCTLIPAGSQSHTIIGQAAPKGSAIADFALVQNAAKDLYTSLSSACTKHTEHGAHLSLRPIVDARHPHVRFTLALRRHANDCIVQLSSERHTWLTVETVFSGSVVKASSSSQMNSLLCLNNTLKRTQRSPTRSPSPPATLPKKTKKSVKFQLPKQPVPAPAMAQDTSTTYPSPDPSLPNLCSHNNFCTVLERFLINQQPMEKEKCIGYLENSAKSKYLVYLDSHLKSSRSMAQQPTSLAALICDLGTITTGVASTNMAQLERLRLAQQLATAVLQFHETPWVPNSWTSNDVYFLSPSDPSSSTTQKCLGDPFVDVSVKPDNRNPGKAHYQQTFAPNALLFGLGVMLLELAFGEPLHSMQRPQDVANSSDGRHTEFFTARRVSQTLSTTLGSRYSRVVQRCLQCDFGCGNDLEQVELQWGVYKGVVCELDRLEKALRELGIE